MKILLAEDEELIQNSNGALREYMEENTMKLIDFGSRNAECQL